MQNANTDKSLGILVLCCIFAMFGYHFGYVKGQREGRDGVCLIFDMLVEKGFAEPSPFMEKYCGGH